MVGNKPGGVNVFGGGLALYDEVDGLIGAVGVSGDTSCADHDRLASAKQSGAGLPVISRWRQW